MFGSQHAMHCHQYCEQPVSCEFAGLHEHAGEGRSNLTMHPGIIILELMPPDDMESMPACRFV